MDPDKHKDNKIVASFFSIIINSFKNMFTYAHRTLLYQRRIACHNRRFLYGTFHDGMRLNAVDEYAWN